MSQVINQVDDEEVDHLDANAINAAYIAYRDQLGGFPPDDEELSAEQLTTLSSLYKSGRAPYTDMAIWGPFQHRIQKKIKLKGLRFIHIERWICTHWALWSSWLWELERMLHGADHTIEAGRLWENDPAISWPVRKGMLGHHLPSRRQSQAWASWEDSSTRTRSLRISQTFRPLTPIWPKPSLGMGLEGVGRGLHLLEQGSRRAIYALPCKDRQPHVTSGRRRPDCQGVQSSISIRGGTNFKASNGGQSTLQETEGPRRQSAPHRWGWHVHTQPKRHGVVQVVSDRRMHWEGHPWELFSQSQPSTPVLEMPVWTTWCKQMPQRYTEAAESRTPEGEEQR